MESAFATEFKQNVSPGHINADIDISLQDGGGRRWPIVLEFVRAAGQRHVWLN
jgi:hypothetical protein